MSRNKKYYNVGDLVKIKYDGKSVLPSKLSGWRYSQDELIDNGKIAIILYDAPHVTTAGEFMYVLTDRGKCLHHVFYLEDINDIDD